ncbi:MAG: PDZ domain-containing protein [Pyrinomonadaceae bacterium]
MIRISLAFLFVGFVLVSEAQSQTPAPGARGETRAFSMFFDGDGGYLGVQTEDVTKDNFAKYALREVRGVAVEKVMEGSPAEKAGIRNGDVIVRFNNEEVSSMRKLTRLLSEVSPDHQAKLTVIRNGGEREIRATLGKRPTPKLEDGAFGTNTPRLERFPFPPSAEMPALPPPMQTIPLNPGGSAEPFVFRMGSSRKIGVGVTTLTKQLSEHFGVISGVMINEVRSGSPAAKAGLKAGDIIVEVEGEEVKGDIDLIHAIAEKKEGDVTVTIVRDRNRQTIPVTPEEVIDVPNAFYVLPIPDQPGPDAPPISWPRNSGSLFRGFNFPRIF